MPLPKPTALHKRDGTYHSTRHGVRADAQVEFASGLIPLVDMDGEALEMWEHLNKYLPSEILKAVDTAMLVTACEYWQEWRELLRDWRASDKEDHRLWQRVIKAGQEFRTVAMRFGMSPIDRAKLTSEAASVVAKESIGILLNKHIEGNN